MLRAGFVGPLRWPGVTGVIKAVPSDLLSSFDIPLDSNCHTPTPPMENYKHHIQQPIQKGGPDENDYSKFDAWVTQLHKLVSIGRMSSPELTAIRSMFGAALSAPAMQGFALAKPHGYSDDYDVIDRIYQHYVSPNPHLANWDHYHHRHARRQPIRVLKIAIGLGRNIADERLFIGREPQGANLFPHVSNARNDA